MIYYGKNRKLYELEDKPLGSGGEGSVYRIKGDPGSVAKIYKPERLNTTAERTRMKEKLEAMLAAPLSPYTNGQLVIAWPTDILLDNNGTFHGFVMPFLQGKKAIFWVYREWERQQLFKNKYRWDMSVAVAYNLATAVSTVHKAGIVIGDFNSNNIQIDNHGIVTLIDTDSFNVTTRTGKVFKCGVGVPEMLPPELQGKDLSLPQNQFTKATDRFSLAIHIFMLLCNNCHPFNCVNVSGPSASLSSSPAVKNITSGYCPYVSGVGKLPPSAPDMAFLPQEIRTLFERAFKYDVYTAVKQETIDRRPTADEWIAALGRLYNSKMTTCSKDPLHRYPAHYTARCPWCAILQPLPVTPTPQTVKNNQTNKYSSVTGTSSFTGSTSSTSSSTSTRTTTTSSTSSTSRSSYRTHREPWLLYLMCIVVGILGAAYPAEFITYNLIEMTDVSLDTTFVGVVLAILGLLAGWGIAALASDRYQYSNHGWPWLLLSVLAPIASWIGVFLLALALMLFIGAIAVVFGISIVFGILAALCGGG